MLVEKDEPHARLNQMIITANIRSEAIPVEKDQHTSPIERLLQEIEDGRAGTNQVHGGAAGGLG